MEQVGPVNQPLVIFKHFRIAPDGELKHYRRGKDSKNQPLTPWTPRERGGMTICYLYQKDNDNFIGMGMAHCSLKDQFCYRIGRLISEGRARKTVSIKGEMMRIKGDGV